MDTASIFQVPMVWLPVNETSWLRPERVPTSLMSKPLQVKKSNILSDMQ